MPSPILKGITTIIWGTDNFAATPGGAIIESGKITPKNGAPVEIEGNNGFAAVLVFLDDGFDGTVTALYDTAKAWPGTAQTVVLNLPIWGANGGVAAYNCFVAAIPEVDEGRKKETMITYKLIYRPGVPAT